MIKYFYVLIICYNLNLLLNIYTEIMLKIITIFNYKNTTNLVDNTFLYDIILYKFYTNKPLIRLISNLA